MEGGRPNWQVAETMDGAFDREKEVPGRKANQDKLQKLVRDLKRALQK
jgi:hypothetical protein